LFEREPAVEPAEPPVEPQLRGAELRPRERGAQAIVACRSGTPAAIASATGLTGRGSARQPRRLRGAAHDLGSIHGEPFTSLTVDPGDLP